MTFDSAAAQELLVQLLDRHQVPGASFAVLADGEIHTGAAGVLNIRTGVRADPASVFQIGSISKVYTGTIAMQLVEEGLLELDAPVLTYLPDLRLREAGLVDEVTVRHLLTHTSGIDGDFFFDGGRGDDAVQRYLAACSRLGLTHPVGATMSYSNSGFSLLGAVIERITKDTWDQAVRDRVVARLGLESTVTLPQEALRFRAAYGHELIDGRLELAAGWALPGGAGPAGGIVATAADVVRFAAAHLDSPTAKGDSLLSAESRALMVTPQVRTPDLSEERWIGLAWSVRSWSGRTVIGHDGGTLGQGSTLRVVPDAEVAVCVLANGGRMKELHSDFMAEALRASCGLQVPAELEPPDTPARIDPSTVVGTYRCFGTRLEVEQGEAGLGLRMTRTSTLKGGSQEAGPLLELVPHTEQVYLTRFDRLSRWVPVTFFDTADGQRYAHFGSRSARRVAG